MTPPVLWISCLALSAAVLVGCSGGEEPGDGDANPAANTCGADDKARPFTAGMSETSKGGVKVAVIVGDPAPPRQGRNRWTLEVEDPSGAPLEGAGIEIICTMFHPQGGTHGCPARVVVTDLGGGSYEAYPLVFNMDGHWDVDVTVTTPDGAAEKATFSLCLE